MLNTDQSPICDHTFFFNLLLVDVLTQIWRWHSFDSKLHKEFHGIFIILLNYFRFRVIHAHKKIFFARKITTTVTFFFGAEGTHYTHKEGQTMDDGKESLILENCVQEKHKLQKKSWSYSPVQSRERRRAKKGFRLFFGLTHLAGLLLNVKLSLSQSDFVLKSIVQNFNGNPLKCMAQQQ